MEKVHGLGFTGNHCGKPLLHYFTKLSTVGDWIFFHSVPVHWNINPLFFSFLVCLGCWGTVLKMNRCRCLWYHPRVSTFLCLHGTYFLPWQRHNSLNKSQTRHQTFTGKSLEKSHQVTKNVSLQIKLYLLANSMQNFLNDFDIYSVADSVNPHSTACIFQSSCFNSWIMDVKSWAFCHRHTKV